MATMYVKLEWDEEALGPRWMNIDNLRACLYGADNTRPDLLQVTDITGEDEDEKEGP